MFMGMVPLLLGSSEDLTFLEPAENIWAALDYINVSM